MHTMGEGVQGGSFKESWTSRKSLSSAKYLHKILYHQAMRNQTKMKELKLKVETIFDTWKPFKNDKKCFLFCLKRSFRSQDV